MLDIIGLTASVVTIASAVIDGVKLAKTIYHVGEELHTVDVSVLIWTKTFDLFDVLALQEQIESLASLV